MSFRTRKRLYISTSLYLWASSVRDFIGRGQKQFAHPLHSVIITLTVIKAAQHLRQNRTAWLSQLYRNGW